MSSDFRYEVKGAIGHAVFDRPESRNAMTFDMYEGIAEVCRSIDPDGDVKAIVISGAGGKAFAAGTDMAQFRDFSEPQQALDYEAKMDRVLTDVERCLVPTIAAITGACTGGGAAIAAACDVRITDARLKFGFPIARTLGNCLSVNNLSRLALAMGPTRLRETLLTARLIEADEALTCGLVSEVLAETEAVIPRAFEIAEAVAMHAPLTMRATKEGLYRLRTEGPDADDSDLIIGTYISEDFQEGLEAFLAKRKPLWKGR